MKKALMKDSVKEIRNTFKRFLSILMMAFLGVGFFAGVRATSPDMVDTLDKYYDSQNVYDIQVMSTLGLTDEDIGEISKIENVENVIGTFETDGKVEIDDTEKIIKIMCVEDINKPKIIEGNLPQNIDECVVEPSFLTQNNKKIGDTIDIEIEKTENEDGEEKEYLVNKKLKIVGTVQSPMFISKDRGSSTLGAGKVNYYIYINKENVNVKDVYTNIYVKVKGANELKTSSDDYKDLVTNTKTKIEDIKEEREKARQDELINSATEKLNEAEKEFNDKKKEAEDEIAKAEAEIEDGKKQIEDGKLEISKNEKKANEEFSNAEKQIEQAKEEINNNEQLLNNKEQEANTQFAELEKQKQDLSIKLGIVQKLLDTANETYNDILEALKNPDLDEGTLESLNGQKLAAEEQIRVLEENKNTIIAGINQIDSGINVGKQEIENARKQIEDAKAEIEKQEKNLKTTKNSTYKQIENAKKELENSESKIISGEAELNKQKEEVNTQLNDAEKELIDAREEIAKIEKPTWYVLDRDQNRGYASFIQDTESVANIGRVFPIVFFIVATLISLTSMTRMVEEQRTQIGTLKALGYNKIHIAGKYVLYASLASVIGSILGMCVGFVLIPTVIWNMYSTMYEIGDISLDFNWAFGTIGLDLIFICIVGATIYAIVRELRHTPATLMRPKAPKIGKRVLLERITFIWKRLSFSRKVTIRNIFRYKKRFLMTIIGIMGCTALILTGFGLRDSISRIMPDQYEHIFNYDVQISLKDGLEESQVDELKNELEQKEEITKIIETYMTTAVAINNGIEEDVQIIVPEDKNSLDEIINLYDLSTKEKIVLDDNNIALTDKASELLGVNVGDKIILRDSNDKEVEVTISNIVENYVYHYVYMSKALYENLYGESYKSNVLLAQDNNLEEGKEEALAKDLMENNEISSVSSTSDAIQTMDEAMESLDYVVVVLIVSAGLLAFVVLYNLSNVNISERIRELATIKVLGFYDREVYDYVTRETILLTLIGIVFGLVTGYFLNSFIIGTCEINMLRFNNTVQPLSYLYAILITIAFTLIVNFVTYFALKKIDMIESLKSVE